MTSAVAVKIEGDAAVHEGAVGGLESVLDLDVAERVGAMHFGCMWRTVFTPRRWLRRCRLKRQR